MAVTALLDRTIYTEPALRGAVAAFHDVADVIVAADDSGWTVAISGRSPHEDLAVARPFLTYVLAASLEERLA